MPVRGLEDCTGFVGWAFNPNALADIAADCAADDGTDTTENNNSAEDHVMHYRDEWSLPNTANDGDICITDNNGAVWVWNGWCWRDRDGTTVIQTEDTQPYDAAMAAGGIVEDDEQVAHMDGYDAAANEEPAPVLEVGDYIYNGVPDPVYYHEIEDAMRVVHGATVRGQRARQFFIDDPIDPNVDLETLNDTIARDGNITSEPRLRADPMTQEYIEGITRAIRNGMRFTVGADFALDSAAVDNDDTTDTTEGQFSDIFEVAT